MRDLDFISGTFFDYDVPKEKRYVLKYFKTDLQRAFIRYYMVFGNHVNFVDHTGYYCTRRMLFIYQARYHLLVKTYEEAKAALTEDGMELLLLIESGKFRLSKSKRTT